MWLRTLLEKIFLLINVYYKVIDTNIKMILSWSYTLLSHVSHCANKFGLTLPVLSIYSLFGFFLLCIKVNRNKQIYQDRTVQLNITNLDDSVCDSSSKSSADLNSAPKLPKVRRHRSVSETRICSAMITFSEMFSLDILSCNWDPSFSKSSDLLVK